MKMQNKLIYSLMMILTLMVGFSCKDNFSEKDFLEQQAAQTEEQKQALEEDLTTLAGFILQLVDSQTGEGVAELSVSLSSGDGSAPFTATSDEDGNAKFVDLPTGGYTLLVTGPNYIDLSATIFFNDNSTGYLDGVSVVKRRNESARILMTPIVETNGTAELATISGNVTAELDLTNTSPEIPQDLTVSVALPTTGNAGSNRGPNSGTLSTTSIAGTQGFGSAVVDNTTGDYSIQVPANGGTVSLIFPEFVADQTIAYNQLDNVDLDEPVMEMVQTAFGGNYNYGAIPNVPGAKAVFPTPPEVSGSGLAFTITPTGPAPLGTDKNSILIDEPGDDFAFNYSDFNNFLFSSSGYTAVSLGNGYTTSPTVTVSGGGATTDATAVAGLMGYIKSISTTGGSGYADDDIVLISINARGVNFADDLDEADFEVAQFLYTITGGAFDEEIDLSDLTGVGFDEVFNTASINSTYGYKIKGFSLSMVGLDQAPSVAAEFTVEVDCQLGGIQIVDGGEGYSSVPSITLTGGGGASQAVITSDYFRTKSYIDVDNTNTVPYDILPEITIQVYDGFDTWNDDNVYYNENISENDYADYANDDINDLLYIDENGLVQWILPNRNHLIDTWVVEDGVVVGVSELDPAEQAEATFDITNDGKINNFAFVKGGYGYRDVFGVSIEPTFPSLPGSGAEVQLEIQSTNGPGSFYSWNSSFDVISQGSDYMQNVNQQSFVGNPGSWTSVNNITPGGEYNVDWNYGTGETLVDVD